MASTRVPELARGSQTAHGPRGPKKVLGRNPRILAAGLKTDGVVLTGQVVRSKGGARSIVPRAALLAGAAVTTAYTGNNRAMNGNPTLTVPLAPRLFSALGDLIR